MRLLLLCTVAITAFFACVADEFYLTSQETGKKHGPFPLKTGATIRLGTHDFTLAVESSLDKKVQEKMSSIIFPQIDFRQANIQDVLQYIQTMSRDRDPKDEGVNVLLQLPKDKSIISSVEDALFWDEDLKNDPKAAEKIKDKFVIVPLITMELSKVSLGQLLSALVKTSQLIYKVENGMIIFKCKE